jgi:hypothetical protein
MKLATALGAQSERSTIVMSPAVVCSVAIGSIEVSAALVAAKGVRLIPNRPSHSNTGTLNIQDTRGFMVLLFLLGLI